MPGALGELLVIGAWNNGVILPRDGTCVDALRTREWNSVLDVGVRDGAGMENVATCIETLFFIAALEVLLCRKCSTSSVRPQQGHSPIRASR